MKSEIKLKKKIVTREFDYWTIVIPKELETQLLRVLKERLDSMGRITDDMGGLFEIGLVCEQRLGFSDFRVEVEDE